MSPSQSAEFPAVAKKMRWAIPWVLGKRDSPQTSVYERPQRHTSVHVYCPS